MFLWYIKYVENILDIQPYTTLSRLILPYTTIYYAMVYGGIWWYMVVYPGIYSHILRYVIQGGMAQTQYIPSNTVIYHDRHYSSLYKVVYSRISKILSIYLNILVHNKYVLVLSSYILVHTCT